MGQCLEIGVGRLGETIVCSGLASWKPPIRGQPACVRIFVRERNSSTGRLPCSLLAQHTTFSHQYRCMHVLMLPINFQFRMGDRFWQPKLVHGDQFFCQNRSLGPILGGTGFGVTIPNFAPQPSQTDGRDNSGFFYRRVRPSLNSCADKSKLTSS